METKRCPKCGETKPIIYFGISSYKSSGLSTYCKKCSANRAKEYYKNNAESRKDYSKNYHSLHKDDARKYRRKYRESHLIQEKEWQKNYNAKNARAIQKRREIYNLAHKKESSDYARANRDSYSAYAWLYYEHIQRGYISDELFENIKRLIGLRRRLKQLKEAK